MEEIEEEKQPGASNSGYMIGVPGPVVENVGTLDLRGATAEQVAILKKVKNTGTVLISPEARAGLSGTSMENVGSVIEAGLDEKLLVGPSIEFDAEALDAMEDGQKLLITGIVTFADDAPAALVAQKIAKLRLTGILLASKSVQGILTGRMEHVGVSVTVPKTSGGIVRQIGEKTITPGYLGYLKPESVYINIGQTTFGDDVSLELVRAKLAAYVNVGETVARQEILDYLDAVCESNVGEFSVPKKDEPGDAS